MRILGIETVTRVGSLAVVDSGNIVNQRTIDTMLSHASSLISVLDGLLESINTDISKIDVVAVDVGPGSFTGIRVGIASAKGLAQFDNKRLVGVCSLEVLCHEAVKKGVVKQGIGYLVPFIDAKRGGIYTGWYKLKNDEAQIVKEPYLTTVENLLKEMPPDSYIFGPDADPVRNFYKDLNLSDVSKERKELYLSLLEKKVSNGAEMIEKDPIFPSAGIVAWLAEKKINEGLKEKLVEPMYIYDVEYKK